VPHTICTFNVNNLYVRYRFGTTFPGDRSKKSAITDPREGYLPMYNPGAFEIFNPAQRDLAARALTRDHTAYPDVVCLQEVESLIALRTFNEEHLGGHYRYALLIDGRDLRQIDVGLLSNLEIRSVRSHIDQIDPEADDPQRYPWQFSRDCLMVELALPASGGRTLTLFINHLKSKFVDPAEAKTPEERAAAKAKGDALRRRQAEAVRRIARARFPGQRFDTALFAVVGDLNDQPDSAAVEPLLLEAGMVPALDRIARKEDRWTEWFRSENSVSQLDHVLLSPALAAATAGSPPVIERRGIGFARKLTDGGIGPKVTRFHALDDDPAPVDVDFRFERFPDVALQSYASDHCPVFFEVP
jgi:endonuclease/exonuclease/phosphatase family metal-dependent hydrolase